MILVGDCIEAMRLMAPNSVDAVVTDPPYGIGFMGQAWDGKDIEARATKRQGNESQCPTAWSANGGHKSAAAAAGFYDLSPKAMRAFQEFSRAWASEALRILKPGGHLVSFASPRTYHRMACGIEDAGFEMRDSLIWMFGSGFPKSKNLCTCKPHVETELVDQHGWRLCGNCGQPYEVGTALKPSFEPATLARKPLEGSVEANLAKWGTGVLNIEACRIGTEGEAMPPNTGKGALPTRHSTTEPREAGVVAQPDPAGRWPANLMHDGSAEVIECFPAAAVRGTEPSEANGGMVTNRRKRVPGTFHGDRGGAERFFYCPKTSKQDRDEGMEGFDVVGAGTMTGGRQEGSAGLNNPRAGAGRTSGAKNSHPTVKPTPVMQWLVRLVTPPNGLVVDPFTGSGSTGKACALEGRRFLGMEIDPAWAPVATARIKFAHAKVAQEKAA
jgi:DNA modification methylase